MKTIRIAIESSMISVFNTRTIVSRSMRPHTAFTFPNRKKTGKQLPAWLSIKR